MAFTPPVLKKQSFPILVILMKSNRNCFSKEERRIKFQYKDFIKGVWWKIQKEDWYSRHRKQCARCRSLNGIHLHHKKYPKNGRYLGLHDNDFVALCSSCHKLFHFREKTKKNMQTKSNRFIRENGLAGTLH